MKARGLLAVPILCRNCNVGTHEYRSSYQSQRAARRDWRTAHSRGCRLRLLGPCLTCRKYRRWVVGSLRYVLRMHKGVRVVLLPTCENGLCGLRNVVEITQVDTLAVDVNLGPPGLSAATII